jgi:hypothetical protein
MTIQQRVERMFNPGGSTPVGTGFPLVPFASLPDPLTVEGQVRRPAELPHVALIALSGIWRPLGGRQVLAKRTINPVTVQNLSGEVAETIGPFPGGLVRAGMRLEMTSRRSFPGVGAGVRTSIIRIGSGGARNTMALFQCSSDQVFASQRIPHALDVLADGSYAHRGSNNTYNDYGGSVGSLYYPVVDFSVPWSADIRLISAAETAINITAATWAAGVATFTAAAHTLAVGDKTVIAGVTPSGYNIAAGGIVTEVPNADTFKIAIASDPVGDGTGGTSSRISNMISQSYVLELVG